jgi:hypothetical protein
MMPQGIRSPERIIHGMGYPGKGVPVACMEIKECPSEKSQIHGANSYILSYVCIIIPHSNEFIAKGREIEY